MKPKTKLLVFSAIILIGLGLANLVNNLLNFRESSIANEIEKSKMAANIVKDGLTAHMVNGMMPQRQYYLEQISSNAGIKSLWIVRGENVVKQYGEGLTDETAQDDIDHKVLHSGEMQKKLTENLNEIVLRVTIPYVATDNPGPNNCLNCHDVKVGDVLGAISMEFDINGARINGAVYLFKIMTINLIFVILILFLINYYVSPYTKLFTNMQEGIKKAYRGDFSHNFNTTVSGDGKKIVEQLNTLFSKMQDSLDNIKKSLSVFSSKDIVSPNKNPLDEANQIINELSDIYKFKNTIELDISIDVVYSRIVKIFKDKYNVNKLFLFMVNNDKKTRKAIYLDDDEPICSKSVDSDSILCRAYRTETHVVSTDFEHLCRGCDEHSALYTCFFFHINDEYSLIVSMVANDNKEVMEFKDNIPHLKNYLEAAKPVIESRLLMEKLKENSLKDGLTHLYNRRFLEEFVTQFMLQAHRSSDTYHALMIDVDHFKSINDTYGHDIGDTVIVELASLLKRTIRNSDMAIRYGGEEFLVLLHNSSDDGALKIANMIHKSFSALKFEVGADERMSKTLSVGIAKFPQDGDTIWKCIKCADAALYHAKDTGRDKVILFEEKMLKCDLF